MSVSNSTNFHEIQSQLSQQFQNPSKKTTLPPKRPSRPLPPPPTKQTQTTPPQSQSSTRRSNSLELLDKKIQERIQTHLKETNQEEPIQRGRSRTVTSTIPPKKKSSPPSTPTSPAQSPGKMKKFSSFLTIGKGSKGKEKPPLEIVFEPESNIQPVQKKPIQPPSKIDEKRIKEELEEKNTTSMEKFDNSMETIRQVQTNLSKLINETNNCLAAFALSNSFSQIASESEKFKKNILEKSKVYICSSKIDEDYTKEFETFSKIFSELVSKIEIFISSMEKLKIALSDSDVIFVNRETHIKESILEGIKTFISSVNLDKNKLNALKECVHSDPEYIQSVLSIGIKQNYFSAVKTLATVYAKCFSLVQAIDIQKKGKTLCVEIKERERTSTRKAQDILLRIPREMSQYKDMLDKLIKSNTILLNWYQTNHIPYEAEEKTLEIFPEIINDLKKYQGEVNRLTSLNSEQSFPSIV